MSLPTAIGNNGSFANFGSVSVQPQPLSSVVASIAAQVNVLVTAGASVLPARQVTLPIQFVSADVSAVTVAQNPSISTVIKGLLNPTPVKKVVTLRLPSPVMPTYALTLDAGKVYDPRAAQGFATTATKFQPYEQLTGISQSRPVVVMLTGVQPLFDRGQSSTAPKFQQAMEDAGVVQFMTAAGKYAEAQANLRNIQVANVNQNIVSLKANYANVMQAFDEQEAAVTQALSQLQADATFLLNVVRILESNKSQLDLRNDLYLVNAQQVATSIIMNFSQELLSLNANNQAGSLQLLVQAGVAKSFSVIDVLQKLGYTQDALTNVFASTKLWMQLLVELKAVLQHHSLSFIDVQPTYQKNDVNPSSILIPAVSYFGLSANLPSLPTLDELVNLQVGNASTVINQLIPAYSSIYQNVMFRTEEARIAALSHMISQEFCYSSALTKPLVKQSLQKNYGFIPVAAGNTSVFDAIIGKFGNNITDFSAVQDQSLVSVAQQQPTANGQKLAVLTFETKYVEGDTGTQTAGADFLFSQVLQSDGHAFNTTNIDGLASQLSTQLSQFSTMVDAFNMLALPSLPAPLTVSAPKDIDDGFLSSPSDTFYALMSNLVNPTTGAAQQAAVNDRLGAVYSQARTDNRTKTILFLLTLSKISRNYNTSIPFLNSSPSGDNTPLVNYLIQQLITALQASVPQSTSVLQTVTNPVLAGTIVNNDSMTVTSVTSALTTGTSLSTFVELFMVSVITQFRVLTPAITDNFSVYGGYLDTVIMMAAFDLAIAIVARYSNQQLIGSHMGILPAGAGQVTFAVSSTSTNHMTSVNEVMQRCAGEANLTRTMVMAIYNILKQLSGSLKAASNSLNSSSSQTSLATIAEEIDNQTLLGMLLSEQQIMLLAASVKDLIAASAGSTSIAQPSTDVVTGLANQELTLLDESSVQPASLDALEKYFSIGDLASTEALNKRILTVGLPLGFAQQLKQQVSIQEQKRSSFINSQSDIINIAVYKVDLQNSDIVYKPVKYMFELSRFPIRISTGQWLSIPDNPGLADVINAIPTQCLNQNLDASNSTSISAGVEYASTTILNSSGVPSGARVALSSPTYDFLTAQQKAEILNNHVVSQLLETYIKLMTGVNVGENTYDMVAPMSPVSSDIIQLVVQHTVNSVVSAQGTTRAPVSSKPSAASAVGQTGGILFSTTTSKSVAQTTSAPTVQPQLVPANPAGVAGAVSSAALFRSPQMGDPPVKTLEQQAVSANVDALMNSMSPSTLSVLLSHVQTVSQFANMLSTLADTAAINQKVLNPKQFDRVFNLMIDPRDFVVDVEKTISTPFGRNALALLLQSGDIVTEGTDPMGSALASSAAYQLQATENVLLGRPFPQGSVAPNINNFVFRERDKSGGDLVTDKYFITIETYGETAT